MSTLAYLEPDGNIRFRFVPWDQLNHWLSVLNGNVHPRPKGTSSPPETLNRGSVIQELEARRKKESSKKFGAKMIDTFVQVDRGLGADWRNYENPQGYTHFEELLIFQPKDWRKQVREYYYSYCFDLERESSDKRNRSHQVEIHDAHAPLRPFHSVPVFMSNPTLVTLFHPEMSRTKRYEPLNFLLAYGVKNPLPSLTSDLKDELPHMEVTKIEDAIKIELSPLDYFFDFQVKIAQYHFEQLRVIGKKVKCPRLPLILELDFSKIIGQRLAKHIIRQDIVEHMWERISRTEGELCPVNSPLSFMFAGPSGNGKTELAEEVSSLLNKPGDHFFIKIDCGKLRDANEVFGMSGAYRGSLQGSALNNFILKMSHETNAFGVVLLDEIEKAQPSVIKGLYQVLDKGEWTNKKLGADEDPEGSHTSIVPCLNIIFIMTTNAADRDIATYAKNHPEVYTTDSRGLDTIRDTLEPRLVKTLQVTPPFTSAFMGRVGSVVPFLPMSNGSPEDDPLLGETTVLAKLLIEKESENIQLGSDLLQVKQFISPNEKDRMAGVITKRVIPEAGVRSIQKEVKKQMSKKVKHAVIMKNGGIRAGSHIQYFVQEEAEIITFRQKDIGRLRLDEIQSNDDGDEEDPDMYA